MALSGSLEDTEIPNLQRKIKTMLLGIFCCFPVVFVKGLNSLTKSGKAQILEQDNFTGRLTLQDSAV